MTQTCSSTRSTRAGNARTALALAVVALGTFAAIILAELYAPALVGLGAIGLIVVGFPVAALLAKSRT